MYKKREVILTGFALFAMLFGAGNLIFPPAVGFETGQNWLTAATGFILTGAGFPLMAIIAAAVAGKDLDSFAVRVSAKFSKVFNIALILAIGPLLALPRTGATAFEMIVPQSTENYSMYKFIFLGVFFLITILFSLKSSKVIDRVGAILTPILLIVLAIIIFKGIFSPIGVPSDLHKPETFKYGFLTGYQTMDTLAAIVFSEIILKSIRKDKALTKKQELSFLLQTSVIAIGGLAIVYGGLVYIGATATDVVTGGKGNIELLSSMVILLLGNAGKLILGICVAGACLTTAIGLTATVGDYFSNLLKISYEKIVLFTVVISFIFASFGVDMIVKLAVPILVFIYPISIILIALNFFKDHIKNDNTFTGAVIGAGIVSGYETLSGLVSLPESMKLLYNSLPLSSIGFAWLIPSIVVGIIFSFIKKK